MMGWTGRQGGMEAGLKTVPVVSVGLGVRPMEEMGTRLSEGPGEVLRLEQLRLGLSGKASPGTKRSLLRIYVREAQLQLL